MLDLLSFLNDALYDGLPYALICMSFVLTAKYIRFPDVTCTGSFVLGAAITALTIVRAGVPPVIGVVLAGVGGVVAGALTGLFYTVLRLDRLLAGILSTFVLYSINVMLLTPTVAYGDCPTLFSWFENQDRLILVANAAWHPWVIGLLVVIVLGVKVALDWFLGTEVGLAVRCLEDEQAGEYALERNGLAPSRFQVLALCLGNAIVAMTGGLVSFKEGAANAQRGFDILITGLVAFLLGEQLRTILQRVTRHSVLRPTTGALLGGVGYFGLMTLSQRLLIPAGFTKIALVVLVALAAAPGPNILESLRRRRNRSVGVVRNGSLLQAEGLCFRYPSAGKDSLQELSLSVDPGEVVQLSGANGAGKTTALRLVAGFLNTQDRGTILFRGADMTSDRHERLRRIAYVDQSADRGVVGCLTTQENLALAAMGSRPAYWRRALGPGTVAHIGGVVDRSPFGPEVLTRRADQLSGGQRQVLNLLTLLAKRTRPALVLLDEPTNNLDAENTERCRHIIKTLHNDGVAIVIVSHTGLDGISIDRTVTVSAAGVVSAATSREEA
jgi:putative ABC transport system permease protein